MHTPSHTRPLILITNDDGYTATGIRDLARAVSTFADVVVVAPDGPRSGAACAITPTVPVYYVGPYDDLSLDGETIYSCSGTPVDCIKLAMEEIVPRQPNLILSGINHGDNASVSCHYSGTMGAVLEGCLKGVPSIGFSLWLQHGDWYEKEPIGEDVMTAIGALCQKVIEQGLPEEVCLNVNLPSISKFRGWKVCRQARGRWSGEWASASNPRVDGRHFWLTGSFIDLEPNASDTDFAALRSGYCSIVPITIDMTAYNAIEATNQLLL
ncbi:MAG: 5'/3'-nucleotidase SurE [Bacteroidaceae bacterium]|nr:5'/3'-nucleotidase SurE [Bacteroidaceae bacterium]